MKEKSCWFLVVACGLILAVEAPLVVSSLAADFEGAYPAWESAETLELGSLPAPAGSRRLRTPLPYVEKPAAGYSLGALVGPGELEIGPKAKLKPGYEAAIGLLQSMGQ